MLFNAQKKFYYMSSAGILSRLKPRLTQVYLAFAILSRSVGHLGFGTVARISTNFLAAFIKCLKKVIKENKLLIYCIQGAPCLYEKFIF
jgi:hypothetical protein